jgi:hypothetical protein
MTNFLSFDIYDIDLLKVMNDSDLNYVLLQTTSKSIIVVEDLDRFLTEKSTAMSLFVDAHINFSLCDFLAFKTLANNYLELKDHKFFSRSSQRCKLRVIRGVLGKSGRGWKIIHPKHPYFLKNKNENKK